MLESFTKHIHLANFSRTNRIRPLPRRPRSRCQVSFTQYPLNNNSSHCTARSVIVPANKPTRTESSLSAQIESGSLSPQHHPLPTSYWAINHHMVNIPRPTSRALPPPPSSSTCFTLKLPPHVLSPISTLLYGFNFFLPARPTNCEAFPVAAAVDFVVGTSIIIIIPCRHHHLPLQGNLVDHKQLPQVFDKFY